jgi:hypothetical protein
MDMVPHERSLVKRLADKPFVLLGVNTDESKEDLKKGEEVHKITWRSFHDGSKGPIVKKWLVQGFPTIYVLDGKGVIRYKGVRGKDMDKAVDILLKEMADKKKVEKG